MPRKQERPFDPEAAFNQFRLHGELLSTSLLAMLRDWNAHGYELAKRLSESGLPRFDTGTIYRTLRHLEEGGLISSMWDTSESGPAKRRYSLTQAGEAFLSAWGEMLRGYQKLIEAALGGGRPRKDEDT